MVAKSDAGDGLKPSTAAMDSAEWLEANRANSHPSNLKECINWSQPRPKKKNQPVNQIRGSPAALLPRQAHEDKWGYLDY